MAGETILIGDIHGCAREFGKLLEKIAPSEAGRIVLLGDLVNKGPDPGGVFRMAEAGKFLCLRGNHDNDHLRWQRGQAKPKSESVRTRNEMSARDYEGYLAMVERMPLFYENENLIAVHGAVLAGLRLQDQPDDVLTGDITLESRSTAPGRTGSISASRWWSGTSDTTRIPPSPLWSKAGSMASIRPASLAAA